MTIASGDLSIAICDRCRMQYPYKELRADGNTKGLRVCDDCYDEYDPWRLAPPPPDPMQLRWPRLDAPLDVPDDPLAGIDLRAQTLLLLSEMDQQPSIPRIILINTFMGALVDNGIYGGADEIYVLAQTLVQQALLNWASPGNFTLSVVGTPVFTSDLGYLKTPGSSLDTLRGANAGVNFVLTNCSMSWYINGVGLSVNPEIGINTTTGNTAGIGANGSPGHTVIGGVGAQVPKTLTTTVINPSLYCVTKTGTTLNIYQNGVLLTGGGAVTNQSFSGTTLKLIQGTSCPLPISYARFGKAMSASQALAEYNALTNYLSGL